MKRQNSLQDDGDEGDNIGRERVLAPWQKYALELIGALSILGFLAYIGGTLSTVTTTTTSVAGTNPSDASPSSRAVAGQPAIPNTAPDMNAPRWIVGNWVLAPKGGDDGQTKCGDFNAPSLYRLNDQTARITTFGGNGQYRSYFAYTTPSGEEHYTTYKAKWAVSGSIVMLTDQTVEDAFKSKVDKDSLTIDRLSKNVIRFDGDRYIRCVGPATVFEDEASPSSQPAADAQPAARPTCKSLEPQLAQAVEARTKRKVIEVDANDKMVEGPRSCTAMIITDAGNVYARFGIETSPKGQPILRAVLSESPVI